jgi:dienelactone hydrolase
MNTPARVLVALLPIITANACWSVEPVTEVRRGSVRFETGEAETRVPQQFRLESHEFAFEQQPWSNESERFEKTFVTFPSPVDTPIEVNNTVHCEYYRPKREGKLPAVIVLHILGGDFPLSRAVCGVMNERGVAALFVKLPYYGPRRDSKSERRMISVDPRETVEGMTQAVLDIRRAAAWLASREEIDAARLGICGISLGGITGSLALAAEPRLSSACLVLAGGDIGRIAWESPELEKVRTAWMDSGGTRDEFLNVVKTVDPVTYAANARGRRILMLNADRDEIIPRACTESLWQALGEPEIVWYEGGHYSVARHLLPMLNRASKFFAEPPAE